MAKETMFPVRSGPKRGVVGIFIGQYATFDDVVIGKAARGKELREEKSARRCKTLRKRQKRIPERRGKDEARSLMKERRDVKREGWGGEKRR